METNLVGKSIRIAVPVSVAKALGSSLATKSIQEYCEKLFADELRSLPNIPEGKFDDYIPYMSNVMFMPIILTKMIEQNTTFMTAYQNAIPEIQAQANKLSVFFKLTETDEEMKSLFSEIIGSIFGTVTDMVETDNSVMSTEELTISLENISPRTAISIHVSGATFATAKVANDLEVVKVIHKTYIKPMRNVIESAFASSPTISGLDEDTKGKLTEKIGAMLVESFDLLPLEAVMSIAITKAIEDNTTMAIAISEIGMNKLILHATEKIMTSADFSKYEKTLTQFVTAILAQFENAFD